MSVFKLVRKARRLMKDKFWRAKQNYIGYYEKLPLNDRAILLESEHGKKLDGNIFYLVRYLATSEKYKDYTVYLSAMGRNVRKFENFLSSHGIEGVRVVMLASDEYMRLLASAKYLINDTSFGPYYLKKQGQIYLNTWHGTPLKALGKSDISGYHTMGNVQSNFLKSDYLLYPNAYMKDIMLRDYMLCNLAQGCSVMSGYPRNEIFYDEVSREAIRKEQGLDGKRVYVYMPTYRGLVGKGKTSKSTAYLCYYLYEMEKLLSENEVLYVNLHPLASDAVNFGDFNKIKKFPQGYEVYEFLNVADTLITDYSSVFFDFAVTGRKIILFTYDEEEYLATRGMYMDISSLPFPRAHRIDELFAQLRCERNYDDTEFLNTYCPFESRDASARLCDRVILGEENGVTVEPIPDNGKKNVLIYAGDLASNGITTSLISLLNTVDTEKHNYVITLKHSSASKNKESLLRLPDEVSYICIPDDYNLNILDRVYRKLFKQKRLTASDYMKKCAPRLRLATRQFYGDARIDTVIQFNGYESEVILTLSTFPGRKIIFVHNDMIGEIKTKGNNRSDVLKYAYNAYDKVAVVTEDIKATTRKIAGSGANIVVVKNTINFESILEKGSIPLDAPDYESCTVSFERLTEILDSDAHKFINIGRFAPEKGQIRLIDAFAKFIKDNPDSYLIIMGGNSYKGHYDLIKAHVEKNGLSDRVILIMRTPNPYRILAKCDYFVLSSLYEGFGLVLAEADILGKPVISTDIVGPRLFMQQHGGTLVEDSEAGLLRGMKLLAEGKIQPMGVDYKKYNEEVVSSFEELLS